MIKKAEEKILEMEDQLKKQAEELNEKYSEKETENSEMKEKIEELQKKLENKENEISEMNLKMESNND